MVHTKIGTFLFKLSRRANEMALKAMEQSTERLNKHHHVVPSSKGRELLERKKLSCD